MKSIVTGASRGIGAAIVEELKRITNADVFAPSRSTGYDLMEPSASWYAEDGFHDNDIVVHNVGGGGRYGSKREVMEKNFYSMLRITEWSLAHMKRNNWGRVIAIGSIFGCVEVGAPRPIFHAAKAAQNAWMKSMSKSEYVRNGITFNVLALGNVYVEGKPRVDESLLPMGRMGRPEEVAKLVAFLCSDDAAWINGSTITIDGGESYAI